MKALNTMVLLVCAFTGTAVQAAQLSGSYSNAPATYDLSANSADWVYFGYIPIELDRKRNVPEQITDYSPLNNADPGSAMRINTGYSWMDGKAPAGAITNTISG